MKKGKDSLKDIWENQIHFSLLFICILLSVRLVCSEHILSCPDFMYLGIVQDFSNSSIYMFLLFKPSKKLSFVKKVIRHILPFPIKNETSWFDYISQRKEVTTEFVFYISILEKIVALELKKSSNLEKVWLLTFFFFLTSVWFIRLNLKH